MSGLEWAGFGLAATLLCGLIAHRIGWLQVGISRQTLALNSKKAAPKINSRVILKQFHPATGPDVIGYTINTTIYSDGDLVAREVEGEWKLTASNGIAETTKVVRAHSLPSFLPLESNHEIGGKVSALWCEPAVILQVDINLTYLGLKDLKESYRATYEYDYKNRQMVQRQ